LIVDLEDGVAPGAKPGARDALRVLAEAVPEDGPAVFVRINGADDPRVLDSDLQALDGLPVDGIYLPKATLAGVEAVAARLDLAGRASLPLVALIESARGLLEAGELARHPRVERLAIGEADLTADLGVRPGPDDAEMIPLRLQVVVASAAAGIDPPTGPVSTDFRDLEALRASSEALARLGFAGRATIHPDQLAVVNEVFRPSAEARDDARRLVELFDRAVAEGHGAIVGPDGRMVDEAVVRRARRLLDD
jgi:citrate lyase subunit beta/citryl-CoA lyase